MASHWATEAVHIVPVFGERGALLEHWVFRLFYNWPLTIKRRMPKIAAIRAKIRPRYWHITLCTLVPAIILITTEFHYLNNLSRQPGLKDIWWLLIFIPLLAGVATTLWCKGAALWRRIIAATICGCLTGSLYTAVSIKLILNRGLEISDLMRYWALIIFAFSVLSTIGAIITELKLPDPELNQLPE
jgi:hypothetical protein